MKTETGKIISTRWKALVSRRLLEHHTDVRIPTHFEYIVVIIARNPALIKATIHIAQSSG